MTSIVQDTDLITPTVFGVFKHIQYANVSTPEVLSIDEFKGLTQQIIACTHREGNAGRKLQGIITDQKIEQY